MNRCLEKLCLIDSNPDDPFRYDFRNFADFVWREILSLDCLAAIQADIADYMQNLPMSEDDKARGQIQSLRGAGKTWLVGVFVVWLLYCNPDIKVGIICSTQTFSRRLLKFVRTIIDGHPALRHLAPRLAVENPWDDFRKNMQDSVDDFLCGGITKRSTEPSVKAVGIFGTFTGFHPDVIVSDDVETPENSLTVGKRLRLHEKCREFESLVNPLGMVMYLGTPQSEESLYFDKLDPRYVIRRWPARCPIKSDVAQTKDISPWLLENCEEGMTTYPERFHEEELLVKEAIEGPIMFALQYMLDPTLADADRFELKLSNLIVMDMAQDMAPSQVTWGTTKPIGHIDTVGLPGDREFYAPVWLGEDYVPYSQTVMYIDPAGSGADAVGYCVAKGVGGMIFVPACGGLAGKKGTDGTSDAVMEKLAKIAALYGIKRVVVEDDFGNGMYAKLLAPHLARHCGAVQVDSKPAGQTHKEKRILDVLGPLTRNKRLVISQEVAKNETLMHQYTRITKDRGCLAHEDELEALAGACAEFDSVVLDPEKQDAIRKEAAIRQTALDFQESWRRQAQRGRILGAGRIPTYEEQVAERDKLALRGPRHGAWGARPRGTRGWRRS